MQFDFVSFTTATTGTGTVTVGTATPSFRTLLDAGVPDGTTVEYSIKDGNDRESGTGVVGGTSTTLTRVLSQSTTGSLLNLSGTATVFIAPIAAQYNTLATTAPVASRIYRNTDQSIPNGGTFTDVSWNTAAYETGGEFWSSGATVTIPETGIYQVFAEGTFDGVGLLAAAIANMQILLNGATVISEHEDTVAINAKAQLNCLAQRSFTAGDTLKVQVKHNNATAVNLLAQGDHSPDIILAKLNGAKGEDGPIADEMDETLPIVDVDDFMNNSGGTGAIGMLGWKFTNGTIYVPAVTQNHPGLIGLRTSATANQVCSFYIANAVGTNILRFDEWLEARYIFRPTAANTDCAYQFGPMSAYGSLTPTHGVWLERLSTDTNWFFVSSNASTKTRTDSGVAFAAAWFNVKMRRISASSVGFVLNGGAEVTIDTNIPDAADGLNIGLQRAGTTTTTRDVDLDRIAYKSLAITR